MQSKEENSWINKRRSSNRRLKCLKRGTNEFKRRENEINLRIDPIGKVQT